MVENDSGVAGLGGRLSTSLSMMGYRVGVSTVGTTLIGSRVTDGTGADSALVVHQLEVDLEAQLPITTAEGSAVNGKLTLQIGSDNARLANLAIPKDEAAPSSATGIVLGSGWAPEPLAPEPVAPQRQAPARPAATPSPTARTATPQATAPRKLPPDGSLEPLPTATRPSQVQPPGLTPGPAAGATPTTPPNRVLPHN